MLKDLQAQALYGMHPETNEIGDSNESGKKETKYRRTRWCGISDERGTKIILDAE